MKLRLSKAVVVTSVGALLVAGVPLAGLASIGCRGRGKADVHHWCGGTVFGLRR